MAGMVSLAVTLSRPSPTTPYQKMHIMASTATTTPTQPLSTTSYQGITDMASIPALPPQSSPAILFIKMAGKESISPGLSQPSPPILYQEIIGMVSIAITPLQISLTIPLQEINGMVSPATFPLHLSLIPSLLKMELQTIIIMELGVISVLIRLLIITVFGEMA